MKQYKIAIFIMSLAIFWGYLLYGFIFFGRMFYANRYAVPYIFLTHQITQKHDAEIIMIGDSVAQAGFFPQNYTQLNMANPNSTPIIGYYILKRYLKYNKSPKALILSYLPSHLTSGDAIFWHSAIKFGFLDFSEFKEIIKYANQLGQCHILGGVSNHCKAKTYFIFKFNLKNYNAEIYNAIKEHFAKNSRYKINKEVWQEMTQENGHFFHGRNKGKIWADSSIYLKDFAVNPLYDLYIKKIVSLANTYNISVFYYQMPFDKSSFDKIDSKEIKIYDEFLQSMQERYGIVPLNSVYALHDYEFGDERHHLFNGAPKTTKDILEKIKAWETHMGQ